MKPGQLEPNEFELAILKAIATQVPSFREPVGHLRVLSREFTGVGSFTKFQSDSAFGAPATQIVLEASILMPGVQNGMGAVLFCKGNQPECLEVFTYGEEHWDGMHDGFSIETTV